ncbi:MAG TPA: hypothetical protein EYP63_06310 [Desulfotomaculum sp.]|nr:hypothetical protein [Desulfotomaculum sp.]
MKGKIAVLLLALLISLGVVFSGCLGPKEKAPAPADRPELKSLAALVGEENLSIMHLVGLKAAAAAMKELPFEKAKETVLALTDSGYPVIEGREGYPQSRYSTTAALDGLMAASGRTRGQGNLIVLGRSIYDPLWFAFFDKETGECVYLEVREDILRPYLEDEAAGKADHEGFMALAATGLFKMAKENIAPRELIEAANAEAWHEKFTAKVFGGNEFSILTVCAVWDKGMSHEFTRAVELHNHICPGLTSGYYMAQYLDANFPLGEAERYVVWALPPWCKDDAFQTIFGATVGKRRMKVTPCCFLPELHLGDALRDGVEEVLAQEPYAGFVYGMRHHPVCSRCRW